MLQQTSAALYLISIVVFFLQELTLERRKWSGSDQVSYLARKWSQGPGGRREIWNYCLPHIKHNNNLWYFMMMRCDEARWKCGANSVKLVQLCSWVEHHMLWLHPLSTTTCLECNSQLQYNNKLLVFYVGIKLQGEGIWENDFTALYYQLLGCDKSCSFMSFLSISS